MKKSILTLIIYLFLLNSLNAQWETLNEGSFGTVKIIDFVNENFGWIAANENTILKTTDSGKIWTISRPELNQELRMIDFVNESTGWAICTQVIYKTSDGGDSWYSQYQNNPKLISLFAVDENNVFVVGDGYNNTPLFSTTDGGLFWSTNYLPYDIGDNISMWFINSQVGVVSPGYSIYRTFDGGITWEILNVTQFDDITDIQFINDSTAYFIGYDDYYQKYFICETQNMFTSWIIKSEFQVEKFSFEAIDNVNVIAAVEDTSDIIKIIKSTDAGVNWQGVKNLAYGSGIGLEEIYINKTGGRGFLSLNFFGGRGGPIEPLICYSSYEYTDWKTNIFYYPLADIHFSNTSLGFIVGSYTGLHLPDYGRMFKTTNGGESWDIKFIDESEIIACTFINEFVGFIISGKWNGKIFKTSDTGENWIKIYENNPDSNGYSFHGNDISFIDEENIFVVGRYYDLQPNGAGVLISTDGGESWDLTNKFPDSGNYQYSLSSIWMNSLLGWAVGEAGMIIKYTEQDGWVLKPTVTDLPLNCVYFFNENYGWISGGYLNNNNFQHIVLRTTNAGQNWVQDQITPYLINDLHFIDNMLGWAVGCDEDEKGVILKTTNGGDNWETVVEDVGCRLISIAIKENYGWAAGGRNGLVLRTTDNGVNWVDDGNNTVYPTEFNLEQNFPNPFNPSTTIKYYMPIRSFVTLKIYDVLGNEIETLIDKEQSQGVYEIEYDGSNLSSGVYLYKLEAENYSETRKMILLK